MKSTLLEPNFMIHFVEYGRKSLLRILSLCFKSLLEVIYAIFTISFDETLQFDTAYMRETLFFAISKKKCTNKHFRFHLHAIPKQTFTQKKMRIKIFKTLHPKPFHTEFNFLSAQSINYYNIRAIFGITQSTIYRAERTALK